MDECGRNLIKRLKGFADEKQKKFISNNNARD